MSITLKDIAGYEIEKKEAEKIIKFLLNYEEYIKEGIYLPKGLLLSGEPGVGKTLLAKAIANEAKANFVEFKNKDENIVENLRNCFEEAKKSAPCILFIDELDEIVTTRWGEVTDNQKKTLQTLLTEIDGLEKSTGVIVIATCNLKIDIPTALIRSGRLEKHMTLKIPTYDERYKIFDLYLSKHKELDSISREELAKISNGLTGADINNLINEVLLESKTTERKVSIDDFERYIPVIMHKDIVRPNDDETLKYVAAHEMGHFICIYALKKEIASISVETYGEVGGRVTEIKKNKEIIKMSTLYNQVTITLGGLAGEKVIHNDMTTGAINDIETAKNRICGMMDIGAFGFEYYQIAEKDYGRTKYGSDNLLKLRENKCSEILNKCLENAELIIKTHKNIYDLLIDELLLERRLSVERIKEIFDKNGIDYKKE